MSEIPAQAPEVQLSPPPSSLNVNPDWLTPEGLVDWLICPWMGERANQLILPLVMGEHGLLLSWEGIVAIPLRQDGGPGFHLQGRTGKFNCNLTFQRENGVANIKGNIGLQPVDYRVDLSQNPHLVQGHSGRFHCNFRIQARDNGLDVEGEAGRFQSKLQVNVEARRVKAQGSKQGDRMEMEILSTDAGVEASGYFLGSSGNFSLRQEEDKKILIEGFIREKTCNYTIQLTPDGVQVSGGGAPGDLNMMLFFTPEGYWLKGRLNPGNHFNYTIKRI